MGDPATVLSFAPPLFFRSCAAQGQRQGTGPSASRPQPPSAKWIPGVQNNFEVRPVISPSQPTGLSFDAHPHCFFAFAQHRSNVGARGPAHRDPNPLPQNGSKRSIYFLEARRNRTLGPPTLGCAHCFKVVLGTRFIGIRHTRIPALLIRRGVVTPAF